MNTELKELYKRRKEYIESGCCPLFSKEIDEVEDEIRNVEQFTEPSFHEVMDMIDKGQMRSIFS